MMNRSVRTVLLGILAAAACAHAMIEGTTITDTEENRAVLRVVNTVREALEHRDPNMLLGVVSAKYYEDNGNADPQDDYSYSELKERIIKDCLSTAREIHVMFDIHEIVVDGDRAWADIRYTSRTRLDLPAGRIWDSHKDFDRIQMVREGGAWRIISGL